MSIKPNVFICGTVRNCEPHLARVFDTIKQIETLFNQTHIIIAYDKSDDKSLLKLAQYKALYGNRMDIIINREPLSYRRTENISNARNAIMKKMNQIVAANCAEDEKTSVAANTGAREPLRGLYKRSEDKGGDSSSSRSSNWPYFIMMDMDDICAHRPNLVAIQHALDREAEWETISFNRPNYYDIWALSIKPFIYSSWGWANPHNVVDIMREYIVKTLKSLPAGELLECQSAFNGFAIYKTDPFLKCRYDWRMPKEYMSIQDLKSNRRALGDRESFSPLDQQTDEPDCEHRYFHMSAIADYGARVRISPEHIFG